MHPEIMAAENTGAAPAQTPHRRRQAQQMNEAPVQQTPVREYVPKGQMRNRQNGSAYQGAARQAAAHAPAGEARKAPRPAGQTPRSAAQHTRDGQGAIQRKKAKPRKRLSAPRRLNRERFRRAAQASAKAGQTAAKGLGGLLLLVLLTASEGLGKLSAAVKGLIQTARSGKTEKPNKPEPAAQQEFELELIRPEDYHGRGQAHAQKATAAAHRHLPSAHNAAQRHGAPNASRKTPGTAASSRTKQAQNSLMINRLLSAALLCVALFSLWQIGSIVMRSVKTNQLNDSLSRERAALIEAQGTEPREDDPADVLPDVPQTEDVSGDSMIDMPTPTPAKKPAVVMNMPTREPDIVRTTKYRHVGGDALPEMAALYEKNRDLVAWIQIPDVLDLPVVYRNNSYYLDRDFNKQKNKSGTIFLDVNHPFKEKTQNLLLHGHNMKDGTMFGRLAQYLHDDTYIRNHPFIYFDTLWDKEQYVIFAMLDVSLDTKNERFFNYFTHATFSSDSEFQAYIRQLQLRSYYAIPIDVNPSDALLTLSTCLEDDRLVIVARRLRKNETRSDLRALIRMTTKQ